MMSNHPARKGQSTVQRVANVRIAGIVSASPEEIVTNDMFVGRFGSDAVAEIARMTGVRERHISKRGHTTADLCERASSRLLDLLGWERESIDALIFVSQTPDHKLPATACILQHRLGLSTRTAAFDVNQGCSGYVYGLWLASNLISSGLERVLLLAGDTISHLIDPDDRGTALLFGDAGSATAVERSSEASLSTFLLGSDGRGAKNLIVASGARTSFDAAADLPHHLYMNGSEIFTFTLRAVPSLIKDTLSASELSTGDVDYFLLHQANEFMLNTIAKKSGIDSDKLPINISSYGNTSSASIPLLMTTDSKVASTQRSLTFMLVGFGVGYSWASCLLPNITIPHKETLVI
ncbi:ketoacyl-ACP synthase III [Methylobacterium sp. A49B]